MARGAHVRPISILYTWLSAKRCTCKGYSLQLKIKHCWKLFLFEMLCCVLAWMNEYIVQITEKRQHHFGITGNVTRVLIHAFALHSNTHFFSVKFCMKSEEYFPDRLILLSHLMSLQDIKYFVQNKGESSLFFIDNIQHVTWPFMNDFILPAAWRVFVRKHRKVCCSLLQWSNIGTAIWCRTCTVRFFGSLLRIFSSFPPI